ncbi:putative inner membrane protein [Klebsiella pneumoniae]|nr:putative inner membrane protein [Klebsiella pneumoniae]
MTPKTPRILKESGAFSALFFVSGVLFKSLAPIVITGILLLALLSCLLLPAPSLGLTLAQKLVETFHMMDLNQLYTVLFCLWFLALGAIEYLVLRWVWRRWFSLER